MCVACQPCAGKRCASNSACGSANTSARGNARNSQQPTARPAPTAHHFPRPNQPNSPHRRSPHTITLHQPTLATTAITAAATAAATTATTATTAANTTTAAPNNNTLVLVALVLAFPLAWPLEAVWALWMVLSLAMASPLTAALVQGVDRALRMCWRCRQLLPQLELGSPLLPSCLLLLGERSVGRLCASRDLAPYFSVWHLCTTPIRCIYSRGGTRAQGRRGARAQHLGRKGARAQGRNIEGARARTQGRKGADLRRKAPI